MYSRESLLVSSLCSLGLIAACVSKLTRSDAHDNEALDGHELKQQFRTDIRQVYVIIGLTILAWFIPDLLIL